MRNAERKFYTQNSHNWLFAVKFTETRRKLRLVPTNGNLYHYAGNNPVKYTDPMGLADENGIDWYKEITDVVSEAKIGVGDKFSLSIPNVVQCEFGIDIASNDWVNNKGDTSESGMTSGLSLSGQIGPDNCPLISGSVNYTKKTSQIGNAFALLDVDYEFSSEIKPNTDVEITPPIPFINLTLNLSEAFDLLVKGGNKIGSFIQEKIDKVRK